MNFWLLTEKSLLNRKLSVVLTGLSIAIGVVLLIGVERIRSTAKSGFESTISQTDLIVGARGAPLQILMYSVFHIGNPLNNIRFSSFEKYAKNPEIEWMVPISLGDSYKGYRVVGTEQDFFKHVKVGNKKSLEFNLGSTEPFGDLLNVVIGSEVSKKLHLNLGQNITLSHGVGAVNAFSHDNAPFKVVSVLKTTGTPIDKSVFVSLEAIEAIHEGWESGAPNGSPKDAATLTSKKFKPGSITAFYVGLKSRLSVFNLQSQINNDVDEPLTALMPGLTLRDLWNSIGKIEVALRLIGILVLISNLIGLLLVLVSSLTERRREMAIYRSVGASPFFMSKLLLTEAGLVTLAGIASGWIFLTAIIFIFSSHLEESLGFEVPMFQPTHTEIIYLLIIFIGGVVTALIPAFMSYRQTLSDGLSVRQ
jgi:putative ABC transport system permease protein